MHVAVLMGGSSSEREVSLATGKAVTEALDRIGYRVTAIDVPPNLSQLLASLNPIPDVVFNALHGPFGEDGTVQAILNTLEIPYTHSGVLASGLAMNKPMAKRLFVDAGITCPPHEIVSKEGLFDGDVIPPPYVIKPLADGSSIGVHVMMPGAALPDSIKDSLYGEFVMVEKFIPGQELSVTVMGEQAMTVTEITTERGFYDYGAKYSPRESLHVIPAKISKAVFAESLRISVLAHQTLGCRGISRADIRYDGDALYLLEINTQPGLTPTSLVPEQAAHIGISFDDLVEWIIQNSECDKVLGLKQ